MKGFKIDIIPEVRTLRLTFHRKSASKYRISLNIITSFSSLCFEYFILLRDNNIRVEFLSSEDLGKLCTFNHVVIILFYTILYAIFSENKT